MKLKICNICKKIKVSLETDKEIRERFKLDFPNQKFKDSLFVCFNCYNKWKTHNDTKPKTI